MASSQSEEETKKWGTHLMGAPAAPTVHPDNQQAALWQAQGPALHQPYVVYSPVEKPADNPVEYVINIFNSWSHRAEDIARNLWHNLKTGPSVSEAAWGKVNLTAKAITEGGFESLFKQIFTADPNEKLKKTFACYLSTTTGPVAGTLYLSTARLAFCSDRPLSFRAPSGQDTWSYYKIFTADPNEKLKKTFACYLSTTTGPVAGTLYLSTARLAFCSDRPLSFRAPSGQDTWSYYKVTIPLGQIENVNPVTMKQDPPENYIHVVTTDGHEFWFMGFVNFEKASHHLLDTVSDFRAVSGST